MKKQWKGSFAVGYFQSCLGEEEEEEEI